MKPGPWRQKGKWAVLGVMATAIVMAAALDDSGGTQPVAAARSRPQPVDRAAARPREALQPPSEIHVELERLKRARQEAEAQPEVGNVFAASSWYVPPPPPPPPPPAPPPKPTAPPLPFAYLGRYDDASLQTLILTKGDRVYTVAVGEVIENTYRIESAKAGMIEFIYLPLNIRQSIVTGGAL